MSDVVNVGAAPNDGLGDNYRDAWVAINAAFASDRILIARLAAIVGSGLTGADLAAAIDALEVALLKTIGTAGSATASTQIPASTFVVDNGDGTCSVADPTNANHRGRVLGLVAAATAAGAIATYQAYGQIENVAGTFSAGGSLFIGDGTTSRLGSITATVPNLTTSAWLQTVGSATSASSINLLLGEPGLIQNGPVSVQPPTGIVSAVQSYFDSLPWLPADPTQYPAQGGWFREGDANAYRITRVLPQS